MRQHDQWKSDVERVTNTTRGDRPLSATRHTASYSPQTCAQKSNTTPQQDAASKPAIQPVFAPSSTVAGKSLGYYQGALDKDSNSGKEQSSSGPCAASSQHEEESEVEEESDDDAEGEEYHGEKTSTAHSDEGSQASIKSASSAPPRTCVCKCNYWVP